MHHKKLYGTATVGTKGQVVIPVEARDALDIKTGDKLYVVGSCKENFIGFIKEDQLKEIVEHITDNMQIYKSIFNKTDKD
jgi:AbrB family looped-hinge helix DNA binding protein